ncbi:MAG: carbon-nitrogen hydrolase family protein [Bacteroidia bacterium]|nr:carbon-nitrogen hydrolase family protein [Bacteroidia bacterium]NNF32235.1 carbon-nitrogen hydrolase family protein [Flavobacteriaceae bacterium]MBT8276698.1 carbon-nitrogen hydrolase family protein [Bacteroidia bacterium]NNJ81083.1 carbon-nitrogen hydrolase family protein [Flavobacteriaceae bacterium]NNK55156.1 carbon-nitrogen hydrolase family protein [Flavobacteriaceae bacterium]
MNSSLKVALAQIAPVWLNKSETLKRIEEQMLEAVENKAELIVFGEGLVPGYPFWLALTGGAEWNTRLNKELHAHYVSNSVCIEDGDLNRICELAKEYKIAVYLGIIERPSDRGGHSIYASLVYINSEGNIRSVHRKLQPTYDERLTWSPGDGHGLVVHKLKDFTLGGLNCWENWMPLPRASLYAQGEDLHVAVWPGSDHNTRDITRFIARESRSYVISVSSLMFKKDFPKETPHLEAILQNAPKVLANGGSCIAGPDGEWILEPVLNYSGNLYSILDFNRVLEERQNFDPVGHYSRPDVTKLVVNRERQSTVEFGDFTDEESNETK